MHRVELKALMADLTSSSETHLSAWVPNAPCGVESLPLTGFCPLSLKVPNAPCGVESVMVHTVSFTRILFLMHRVELKVIKHININCGYTLCS